MYDFLKYNLDYIPNNSFILLYYVALFNFKFFITKVLQKILVHSLFQAVPNFFLF